MLHIFKDIDGYLNETIDDGSINFEPINSSLSSESIMALMPKMKRITCKKGELLVEPNTVCRHIYFLEEGAARIFFYKEDKDITDGFRGDGRLLVCLTSFIRQRPDKRGIEILSDSTLWALEHQDLEQLCKAHHDIESMYRLITSAVTIMMERRMERMLFQTAQEKYNDFLDEFKGIESLLSLGMIASFLGMTQETLSRVRGKK